MGAGAGMGATGMGPGYAEASGAGTYERREDEYERREGLEAGEHRTGAQPAIPSTGMGAGQTGIAVASAGEAGVARQTGEVGGRS